MANLDSERGTFQRDFIAYSVRGAAARKAAKSIDINAVLETVRWANDKTFARHYNKLQLEESRRKFTNVVLSKLRDVYSKMLYILLSSLRVNSHVYMSI